MEELPEESAVWFKNEVQPESTLKSHINSVECVQFHPRQQSQIASGSHDKTIKFWDFQKGTVLNTLNKHTEGIWTISFSPTQQTFISGSPDTTVTFWDEVSLKPTSVIHEHKNKVYWAKFNESGLFTASGGADSEILIYDVRKNAPFKKIKTDSKILYSLQWSKDGKYLACSDYIGTVKLYDTVNFNFVDSSQVFGTDTFGEENRAYSCDLDFRPGQKSKFRIYSGFQDNYLRIFDFNPASKKITLLKKQLGHLDCIKNVTLNNERGIFVSCGRVNLITFFNVFQDGSTRIWNSDTYDCECSLVGHTDNVACSDVKYVSAGNTLVASASWDQTICIHKVKDSYE